MGLFRAKLSTIENKLTAVDERIMELKKRAARKEQDVTEAKNLLGERIAEGAMSDSDQVQQGISHSRKALERTADALQEIRLQIEVLTKQRADLETDCKRAMVDEAPERLEGIAREFNKALAAALGKLGELSGLHTDLMNFQMAFNTLLQDRQRALSSLGEMRPLELSEGLGLLATDETATPFRYSVQVPDTLIKCVMELLAYEAKVQGYLQFAKANPDHGNKAEVNQDRAGIGEIGAPNRDKSFRQVFEPGQQR